MGNRPPNEEGTGRFRLTRDRRSIGILDLTTTTTTTTTARRHHASAKRNKRRKPAADDDDDRWEALRLYLDCFFNNMLPIEMLCSAPLRLQKIVSKKKKTKNKKETAISLVDSTRGVEFPLDVVVHRPTNNNNNDKEQQQPPPLFLLEVWSILLVLMEYVRPKDYCLVALIDVSLGEF
jgi:hypothetical protein